MKTTFKRIVKMPYGSSDQQNSADTWYKRFVAFAENHPEFVGDPIWHAVHMDDVGYQARRRWMYSLPQEG